MQTFLNIITYTLAAFGVFAFCLSVVLIKAVKRNDELRRVDDEK